MARIRTIKPSFFTSEDVMQCSRDARLLFIGMWTECDRSGRLEDRPRQIKTRVLPADDDINVSMLLDELHAAGLIDRYVAAGVAVIQVTGFEAHQRPHPKEPSSILPAKTDTSLAIAKREPKVYFIKDRSRQCVKIGVSYRPDFRLASLQTGTLTQLVLLGSCDGGFKLEKELHSKFADFRLNGEWFEESAELLRDIERLCRDRVVMLPVENPSSPVGREGKEYGVLGREGVSESPTAPALISGVASPAGWAKVHGMHLAELCDWVCLPDFLADEFARKSGQAENGHGFVKRWALGVRATWEGRPIGDDSLAFWRARWAELLGSTKKPVVAPLSDAMRERLDRQQSAIDQQIANAKARERAS